MFVYTKYINLLLLHTQLHKLPVVMQYFTFFYVVLNSQPELRDLYNLITPEYAAHWKVIGTLLGVESGIMNAIEGAFPTNIPWCCNKFLETWHSRDTEATWKKIIHVIDSSAVRALVTTSNVAIASPLNLSDNYMYSYIIPYIISA